MAIRHFSPSACAPSSPGEAVQVDRGRDRLVRAVGELRQQARDQAGEDVAGAAGAHRRRAGGIDPHAAVGECDHGALAFEHEGDAVLRGVGARGADAVRLNFGGGLAGEARHFAGVRREHAHARRTAPRGLPTSASASSTIGPREGFEPAQCTIAAMCGARPRPGPDRDHALALGQRFQIGVERDAARFGFAAAAPSSAPAHATAISAMALSADATVTSPAPARSAAIPAIAAAPVLPRDPPTTSTWP